MFAAVYLLTTWVLSAALGHGGEALQVTLGSVSRLMLPAVCPSPTLKPFDLISISYLTRSSRRVSCPSTYSSGHPTHLVHIYHPRTYLELRSIAYSVFPRLFFECWLGMALSLDSLHPRYWAGPSLPGSPARSNLKEEMLLSEGRSI